MRKVDDGEKNKTFIVATNVIARPPTHGLTGTPTARAKKGQFVQ